MPFHARHRSHSRIVDSTGASIRTFTSSDRGGPAATAGFHRFVWDLRYPDAHGIEGGTHLAGGSLRGPVARPGLHQVRLTAGGETLTQPLRVVKDPASPASDADLAAQFDLLVAIRDKVSETHDAVNRIRKLRADTATLRERAGASRSGRPVDAAAARLDAALSKVLNDLAELRFEGFDDQMLVFDLKLNNRMAALQNYVALGDYRPTDQQQAVFKEVSALIDAQLVRLRTALATDLPALNKAATAAGMPAISDPGGR